ncbi:hypothetical protein POM88_019342 [Heracleum sosnowskyi]|uniref:rRNA N-glycosylase n=1 Tax=Heracleum sosnowskyi TaxID=360622 RepID=A0AAD8IS54_9APIA|nr:hypothetical protein POM88_019342 [Heracleum sosnowskyi]
MLIFLKLFALNTAHDDRRLKARRILIGVGFARDYTYDFWFQEGYWSMSGAANCKRHEIYICKEDLIIAFKTLFNHTNGKKNTSVPKALLYIVQVFLECVRINLQRTIIIVSFDKGLYFDEMIIRYQHDVSAASLFHRLDHDHSDQTRFFQFIVDMVKLGLVEVNDIYGRYLEGKLTGRRTIDLQAAYVTSKKPIIPKGNCNIRTGKSTMIAAMANLLNYDIYDLDLTAVRNNTELRMLLTETTSKSIIVIEDIDCSLDLSGLLNFIDGLWSACGGKRIIVLTTNYVEKLNPALIRTGRMDKHVEMSYCSFEGFKVLAKNYLEVEAHPTFDLIQQLIEEINTTLADVTEKLMPKMAAKDADVCVSNLIRALDEVKDDQKRKEVAKA